VINIDSKKILNLGKNGTYINRKGDFSIEEAYLENIEEFTTS
jgi:hypothetical protein